MEKLINRVLKFFRKWLKKPTLFLVLGIVVILYESRWVFKILPSLSEIDSINFYSLLYLFMIFSLLLYPLFTFAVVVIDRLLVHFKVVNYKVLSLIEAGILLFFWLANTTVIPENLNPFYDAFDKIDKRVQIKVILEDPSVNYFIVFFNDTGINPFDLEDGKPKEKILRTTENSMVYDRSFDKEVSQINFEKPESWGEQGLEFQNNKGYVLHAYYNTDSISDHGIDSLIQKEMDKRNLFFD